MNDQRAAIFVLGQDGTGKTTLVKEQLLPKYHRVLILDADLQEFDAYHAQSLEEVIAKLTEWDAFGTHKPFRISFTPLPDEIDICFLLARDIGDCVIIAEEADRFHDVGHWQTEYIYRGRHWGVSVIGLTLQPMALPKDYRRILRELYSFRQIEPSDIDYTAQLIGKAAYEIPKLEGPEVDDEGNPTNKPPFPYLKWAPGRGAKIIGTKDKSTPQALPPTQESIPPKENDGIEPQPSCPTNVPPQS